MAMVSKVLQPTDICEALGLDPAVVSSITIHCQPNELVIAEVKMIPRGETADKLLSLIKRYALHEISEKKPEDS